jgi:hypothetical protein
MVQVADLDLHQVRMGKVCLGKAQGDEGGTRQAHHAGMPRAVRRELGAEWHADRVSQGADMHTPVPGTKLHKQPTALGNVSSLMRASQVEADAACAFRRGGHVHCHNMRVGRVHQRSQQVRDPRPIALGTEVAARDL